MWGAQTKIEGEDLILLREIDEEAGVEIERLVVNVKEGEMKWGRATLLYPRDGPAAPLISTIGF